jgi:hypothetical protein
LAAVRWAKTSTVTFAKVERRMINSPFTTNGRFPLGLLPQCPQYLVEFASKLQQI